MNISILDDHKIVLQLLSLALQDLSFVNSVNLYTDAEKFFARLDIFPSDILITDMLMPNANGIDIISSCRKLKNKEELRIVVLSSLKDANAIKSAFEQGANAYLGKDGSLKELSDTLNMVYQDPNINYVGESLKNVLIEFQLFEKKIPRLSPRETELLQHICKGETTKEIAAELDLRVNTIQSYMKQLMRKLEVNRTPDLILKAIELGLFVPKQVYY